MNNSAKQQPRFSKILLSIKESLKAFSIVAVLIANNAMAQDPKFSQYFTSPSTINPSFIGKGVEDIRISSTARSQWWGSSVSPYNTITMSIEKRIATDKTGNNELGIGLMMLSDGSNNGLLKNNFVGLSAAYNLSLDAEGTTKIGTGIAVNFANRILDANKFQFQSQFGSMGFQRSLPSNDFVLVQKNQYVDVNAGINFSKKAKHSGYVIGIGYFHANRPSEGAYNNSTYSISPRTSIQGQYYTEIGASKQDQIHFSGLAEYQGGNQVYTLGSVYKIKLATEDKLQSVNVGLFSRFGDAIYPYVGLESNRWLVGLSYDAVSSKFKTAYNSVSSMELSFVWQLPGKKIGKEKVVPTIVGY